MAMTTSFDTAVRVIEPRQPRVVDRLREAWAARRLCLFFGRRFVQKTYLRTWLGWIWVPLRPILDVGSRVFVFGGLIGAPSEGIPYFLYVLVGMSAWEMFDRATYWSTRSLEINRRYLKRMYVPRLTILAGGIFPALVNYGIYFVFTAITLALMSLSDGKLYLEVGPDLLLLPAGLVTMLVIAMTIGLWTSVFGAQARDVRFVMHYVISFWFFLTPVVLPLSSIPHKFRLFVELNPVTSPIEMVKHGLLGTEAPQATSLISTAVFILIAGSFGLRFFSRSEAAALDSL
jgi:lipopolysaccharide transport system permease protein